MEQEPARESRTSKPVQDEADPVDEQHSTDSAQQPEVDDDGSVPTKQISRWKGEGGSWLATD